MEHLSSLRNFLQHLGTNQTSPTLIPSPFCGASRVVELWKLPRIGHQSYLLAGQSNPDPPDYDSQNMQYFCYIYIGEILFSARGSRRKRELDQVRLLGIAF